MQWSATNGNYIFISILVSDSNAYNAEVLSMNTDMNSNDGECSSDIYRSTAKIKIIVQEKWHTGY